MPLLQVPKWREALPTQPLARAAVWHLTRALNRVQHLTWLPLVVGIGRFNFIAIAWAHALQRRAYADVAAMALHWLWYGALLSYGLETAREQLLFTVVHYVVVGILHVQACRDDQHVTSRLSRLSRL